LTGFGTVGAVFFGTGFGAALTGFGAGFGAALTGLGAAALTGFGAAFGAAFFGTGFGAALTGFGTALTGFGTAFGAAVFGTGFGAAFAFLERTESSRKSESMGTACEARSVQNTSRRERKWARMRKIKKIKRNGRAGRREKGKSDVDGEVWPGDRGIVMVLSYTYSWRSASLSRPRGIDISRMRTSSEAVRSYKQRAFITRWDRNVY
jgi:hypothetical protein